MASDLRNHRADKPVKKRNSVERILVWSGIALLLALVVMEATSRYCYDSSLAALDTVIPATRHAKPIPGLSTTDVDRHIKGFPFRRQEVPGNSTPATNGKSGSNNLRKLLLRWPSLFKTYELAVTFNEQDRAILVESSDSKLNPIISSATVGQSNQTIGNAAPNASPKPDPLPKMGLARTADQTVILSTDDPKIVETMRKVRCGALARELIRQSVLIAARDELGLDTLDATLGEVTFVKEAPESFPFQVDVSLETDKAKPEDVRFIVHISRADPEGNWFKWSSPPVPVTANPGLDAIAERMEVLSRDAFAGALKEAGLRQATRQSRPLAKAPEDFEQHLDFVAQFSVLRQLHSQRRLNGETIENLGALVRVYANLGSITDFHWSPMSKAFKARSLLYAQRLLAKFGKTPHTLAHRAYAWALTGNHALALQDIKASREASKGSVPDWTYLIEAFCEYQPEMLDDSDRSLRELSLYLRMRCLDPVHDREQCLKAIERLLAENPASFRSLERMCETRSLMPLRMATEGAATPIWQSTYERLAEIPDLPPKAADIATEYNLHAQPATSLIENRSRTNLISELRQAAMDDVDSTEPSWNVLAEMISDVTFVQTWRALDVQVNWLGFPATSIDQAVKKLVPLVKEHRFANYLTSFNSDSAASATALTELFNSTESSVYDMRTFPLVYAATKAKSPFYQQLCHHIDHHWDKIYDDVLGAIDTQFPDWLKQTWPALIEIAPHQPRSIVYKIHNSSEFTDEKSNEWEQKYDTSGYILLELARKHRSHSRFTDAVRCLKKSIVASPSYDAYFELVDEYQQQNDLDAAEETLLEALNVPSFGLEQSQAHEKLATMQMRQERWDDAKSHATLAAMSYSGAGLMIGARCAEGLKDWKEGERYVRAAAERYDNQAEGWYFWCLRNGRGNLKAARRCAEKHWKTLGTTLSWDQRWGVGTNHFINGDLNRALDTFTAPIDKSHQDSRLLIIAAILADKLNDTQRRDQLFKNFEAEYESEGSYTRLVGLLRNAVRDPNHFRWNRLSFHELSDENQGYDVAFTYYCAGAFLGNHGEDELSRQYLQTAATAFDNNYAGSLLAALTLRDQKISPGEYRIHNQPDDRYPSVVLLRRCYRAKQERKYQEARLHLNQAIERLPDFAIGLLARGQLNEAEGRFADAAADYQQVLQLNPDSEYAHFYMAAIRATSEQDDLRNGKEALQHAERAVELRGFRTPWHTWALAAAHAECGNFEKAIELQEIAVKTWPNNEHVKERMALYRERKPARVFAPKAAETSLKENQ